MWRVALSLGLLAAEYLTLSLLVDLPTSGPAQPLVDAVRVAVPVALGAAGAAAILAGPDLRGGLAALARTLPPWRPWPALVAQLAAFAATAAGARALLGPGAPPLEPAHLALWLAAAAGTALLALAVLAPLRWLGRTLAAHAGWPVLALGGGLLSWRAAAAAEASWGALSGPTLQAVAALTALAGGSPDVIADDRIIGSGDFYVQIAPICSGADGVGMVLVFQGLWLALARRRLRFPRVLLLLPAGAAAAFLGNAVRLAGLLLLGAAGAEEIALGGFHSKAGWLLFLAIALGSVALAERAGSLRRPETPERPASALPDGAAAHLAPLLVMLAAALATGALAAGPLDRLYGARAAAAVAALFALRRALPRPALAPGWAPVGIGAAVAAVWTLVPGGDGAAIEASLHALAPAEQGAWLAARLLGSVLVVPVVEELAFRGFLLPWLAAPGAATPPTRAFGWTAILASSAAFGALHGGFLLGTLAGIAFALARAWRGRLSDAIVAHAVANAGVAIAVLGFGRWDLWA